MEETITNLNVSEIKVTLTPLMIALAIPISFAIQIIKVFFQKLPLFQADEIKKSFFPLVSIALTAIVYYFVNVQEWLIAGVVMGLAASGGYQAFTGTAGLMKLKGN